VSPVRYELGFYISEDGIFLGYRRVNLGPYFKKEIHAKASCSSPLRVVPSRVLSSPLLAVRSAVCLIYTTASLSRRGWLGGLPSEGRLELLLVLTVQGFATSAEFLPTGLQQESGPKLSKCLVIPRRCLFHAHGCKSQPQILLTVPDPLLQSIATPRLD
jgi:hypothetical protein